ncbi:hypothetical protein B0H13DRAFT_2561641 [Mycena leptocephala]|nr:hypothetical protein B0H13DRAFT_2561641 [Mycena leptocephala]
MCALAFIASLVLLAHISLGRRYFVSALTPGRSRNGFYSITLVAAGPDIVLGLDWKASIRELLVSLGRPILPGFDPFQAYLGSVPQTGLILSPSPAAASQLLELNPEFCTPVNVPTRVRLILDILHAIASALVVSTMVTS